jgi:uncharacterized protein (TIGR03067 family)
MWKMALPLTFIAVVWVGAQACSQEPTAADKSTPVTLVGDYRIVSVEISGEKEPEERIVGTLVHVTEDQLLVEDRDHKSTPYIATYELDTKKKPYGISMTGLSGPTKGETVKGLIEKEGDQLRLIYAFQGGELPTDFKSKDKQLLIVMKAVTK